MVRPVDVYHVSFTREPSILHGVVSQAKYAHRGGDYVSLNARATASDDAVRRSQLIALLTPHHPSFSRATFHLASMHLTSCTEQSIKRSESSRLFSRVSTTDGQP